MINPKVTKKEKKKKKRDKSNRKAVILTFFGIRVIINFNNI